MRWIPYGPNALLLRFADRINDKSFARGRALVAELERQPPPGLVEFVPSFTSILLEFDPQKAPDLKTITTSLNNQLKAVAGKTPEPSPVIEIRVVYDGPDLQRVAQHHQLSIQEVIQLHAAPVYKVYSLGFAPGFPYLGDLNPKLHTPRLENPRIKVPAGAVAIGGEHTGIYSMATPGGWNLIGRTSLKLFDPDSPRAEEEEEAMFLLGPGDRVQFVAQTEGIPPFDWDL